MFNIIILKNHDPFCLVRVWTLICFGVVIAWKWTRVASPPLFATMPPSLCCFPSKSSRTETLPESIELQISTTIHVEDFYVSSESHVDVLRRGEGEGVV